MTVPAADGTGSSGDITRDLWMRAVAPAVRIAKDPKSKECTTARTVNKLSGSANECFYIRTDIIIL